MKGVAVMESEGKTFSNHYIYDVTKNVLRYYRVHVDFEHDRVEVYSLTPNADVENAVHSLRASITQYNNQLDQDAGYGLDYLTNSTVYDTSLCGDPSASNVYDVISDSNLRKNLYDDHANIYPVLNAIAADAGHLISISVSIASRFKVNLDPIILPIKYTLPTGGTIKLGVNPLTETFDVIPGTARDCSDNNVPNRVEDLAGEKFRFDRSSTVGIFISWAGSLGVGTGNVPTCTQDHYLASCSKGTDDVIHCPVTCLD
jgi:hypothetical protein